MILSHLSQIELKNMLIKLVRDHLALLMRGS